MTQTIYRQFVVDVCSAAGIAAPDAEQAVLDLQVKGVNFSIYHCGDHAPAHAVMYCDFGAIPAQARETVLLRLLQTNLYLFGADSPTFTCNPDTGHVLLAAMLPLATARGAGTLDMLGGLADMAMEWRSRHFLSVAEQSGATASAAGSAGAAAGAAGLAEAAPRVLASGSTAARLAQRFARPA